MTESTAVQKINNDKAFSKPSRRLAATTFIRDTKWYILLLVLRGLFCISRWETCKNTYLKWLNHKLFHTKLVTGPGSSYQKDKTPNGPSRRCIFYLISHEMASARCKWIWVTALHSTWAFPDWTQQQQESFGKEKINKFLFKNVLI